MGAPRVRPRSELARLLTEPDAYTGVGALRATPLLVFDLSGSRPRDPAAGNVVRLEHVPASLPVVIVGVGPADADPLAARCDVVVDDDDAVAPLAGAVAAHPHAATTLVQLLRLQAGLAPLDALAAESLAYATLQGGGEFAAWLAARGTRVRRPDPTPRVRVDYAAGGRVATITLDRPRLYNLYDAATRDELVDALRGLAADPAVERIELKGAGKAFCAGGDLAEFGTTRDSAVAHLVRSSANAAPLLVALAPRLHAHVHGPAVGAGCELAAFAGRVTATPGATFALPEVAMGLVPGAGGTVSVARRIGRRRLAWMALTGSTIDARTALAWGLVDDVR